MARNHGGHSGSSVPGPGHSPIMQQAMQAQVFGPLEAGATCPQQPRAAHRHEAVAEQAVAVDAGTFLQW